MWPLILYGALILCIAAGMILVSCVLGERHCERATGQPFESGMRSTGSTYLPYGAHFYLVALIFVLFDLEAAFILAWAVAARELGTSGYAGFLFFIAILTVILVYEWRQGALDWAGSVRGRSATGGVELPVERRDR